MLFTCKSVVLTVQVVRLHIVPGSEATTLPGPGDQRGRVGLHLAEELQHQTVLLQPPVVGEEEDGRVEDHQLDVEAVHLQQGSPLSLVEVQRGSALIGRELFSVATPATILICMP